MHTTGNEFPLLVYVYDVRMCDCTNSEDYGPNSDNRSNKICRIRRLSATGSVLPCKYGKIRVQPVPQFCATRAQFRATRCNFEKVGRFTKIFDQKLFFS